MNKKIFFVLFLLTILLLSSNFVFAQTQEFRFQGREGELLASEGFGRHGAFVSIPPNLESVFLISNYYADPPSPLERNAVPNAPSNWQTVFSINPNTISSVEQILITFRVDITDWEPNDVYVLARYIWYAMPPQTGRLPGTDAIYYNPDMLEFAAPAEDYISDFWIPLSGVLDRTSYTLTLQLSRNDFTNVVEGGSFPLYILVGRYNPDLDRDVGVGTNWETYVFETIFVIPPSGVTPTQPGEAIRGADCIHHIDGFNFECDSIRTPPNDILYCDTTNRWSRVADSTIFAEDLFPGLREIAITDLGLRDCGSEVAVCVARPFDSSFTYRNVEVYLRLNEKWESIFGAPQEFGRYIHYGTDGRAVGLRGCYAPTCTEEGRTECFRIDIEVNPNIRSMWYRNCSGGFWIPQPGDNQNEPGKCLSNLCRDDIGCIPEPGSVAIGFGPGTE